MRKLSKKQLLTKMFALFFASVSSFYTINPAMAESLVGSHHWNQKDKIDIKLGEYTESKELEVSTLTGKTSDIDYELVISGSSKGLDIKAWDGVSESISYKGEEVGIPYWRGTDAEDIDKVIEVSNNTFTITSTAIDNEKEGIFSYSLSDIKVCEIEPIEGVYGNKISNNKFVIKNTCFTPYFSKETDELGQEKYVYKTSPIFRGFKIEEDARGEVSNNSIAIDNCSFKPSSYVSGFRSDDPIMDFGSLSGTTLVKNELVITNSVFDEGVEIIGASVDHASMAKNNELTLKSNTFTGNSTINLYACYADTAFNDLINNSITIEGLDTKDNNKFTGSIYGAYTNYYGFGGLDKVLGKTDFTISNNKVIINNANRETQFYCNVFGGYLGSIDFIDVDTKEEVSTINSNLSFSLCNNSVFLEKAILEQNVYASYLNNKFDLTNSGDTSEAIKNIQIKDNHVTLAGNVEVKGTVYGWYNGIAKNPVDLTKVSGNYLEVINDANVVNKIENFDELRFILSSNAKNGDRMLLVNEAIDLNPIKTILVDTTLANNLRRNDVITLLESNKSISNYKDEKVTLKGLTTKEGEIKLEEDKVLRLKVLSEEQNENTKAPSEGIAGASALVGENGNFVASDLSKKLAAIASSYIATTNTFAAIGGGKTKLESGSYVKTKSWNLGAGIGTKGKKNPNSTYGFFVTYGKSRFDTHNNSFVGTGKSKASSLGLMFHSDSKNNYYYEGSVFLGSVRAEWSNPTVGGYDDKATYRGFNFGMGRRHELNTDKVIDIYGRFMLAHTNEMHGQVSGLDYTFAPVESKRLRLGFRVEGSKDSKKARPFYGLAFEREFDNQAKATMNLGAVDAPSLKGDTGILEVGYKWTRGPWDFCFTCEGTIGKRKGVTGAFNVFYNY